MVLLHANSCVVICLPTEQIILNREEGVFLWYVDGQETAMLGKGRERTPERFLTSLNGAGLFLCPCLCVSHAPDFSPGNSPHADLRYGPHLYASCCCSHVIDWVIYPETGAFS